MPLTGGRHPHRHGGGRQHWGPLWCPLLPREGLHESYAESKGVEYGELSVFYLFFFIMIAALVESYGKFIYPISTLPEHLHSTLLRYAKTT